MPTNTTEDRDNAPNDERQRFFRHPAARMQRDEIAR
jgi:hypothetical protein